jgi:hypothetical protein
MPVVNIDAMNQHLAEISKCVSVSAIALLILRARPVRGVFRARTVQHQLQ